MDSLKFLNSVWPDDGWYCLLAINGKSKKQKLYKSIDTAAQAAHQFDENGFNTYFAVSSFKDDSSRKADNVLHTKAMFLDIDCGEKKAAEGIGYATKGAAFVALKDFCKSNKLPCPTVVDSGRGLHIYWALTEAIPIVDWKPAAERLKALTVKCGLLCDPAVTADSARVLRVPQTHNYKDEPAKKVEVQAEEVTLYDFDEFCALLGDPIPVPLVVSSKHKLAGLSALDKLAGYDENYANSFKLIVKKTNAGNGCEQIRNIINNQEEVDEPLWRAGLSIAKFCDDGEESAHKMSCNHPDYDEDETDKKLDGIEGPHTCETFNSLCAGICTECPYFGKIKSPIVLGKAFKEAPPAPLGWDAEQPDHPEQVNGKDPRPPCPWPFKWGAEEAGIYEEIEDKDGNVETKKIYEHNLYIRERINDEGGQGECAVFALELPHDGEREFTIPLRELQTTADIRKGLSEHGVICEKWPSLEKYTTKSLIKLQNERMAVMVNKQLGWTADRTGFVIGDRTYRKGKKKPERNYPNGTTKHFFRPFSPVGTLKDWKYTVNCYKRKDMELRQFLILLGLASPLMEMIDGVAACGFHVYCKDSGIGKTSAMNAALTAWGDPEFQRMKEDDTKLSRVHRIAGVKSMPVLMDEMTNSTPEDLSALTYTVSEGHERMRLTQKAEEVPKAGAWSLLFVTTANTSILERISMAKHNPNAEAQRLLECTFEEVAWDVDEDLFNASLVGNRGHAGPIFIQYVMDNYDEVRERVLAKRKYLIKKYGLSSKNRFWSAGLACILVTGEIAKHLNLVEYDMEAIEKYVETLLSDNKINIINQEQTVGYLISSYLAENHAGLITVKGSQTAADKLAGHTYDQRLYGDIVGRFETETKELALNYEKFTHWLTQNQAGAKETVKEILADMDGSIHKKFHMTAGTTMPYMGTRAIVIKNYSND